MSLTYSHVRHKYSDCAVGFEIAETVNCGVGYDFDLFTLAGVETGENPHQRMVIGITCVNDMRGVSYSIIV